MAAIDSIERNPAYRTIVIVGSIGTALTGVGWLLRQMNDIKMEHTGSVIEGTGLLMVLISILLVYRALNKMLAGQQELMKKNTDLVTKAERLEKELTTTSFYINKAQEGVNKLYYETQEYFEFAADIHTYRMETAIAEGISFNGTALYEKHIQEAKLNEWSKLDKHFERKYPNMAPVERRKNMAKVMGYRLDN